MQSNPTSIVQRHLRTRNLRSAAYIAVAASAATVLLSASSVKAQNAPNNFTGSTSTDLTDPTNYSLGSLPTSTQDVLLTATPGTLTNNGSIALTMGSLDLSTGAYAIDTSDGGASSITLGGGLNQVVGSDPADLIYMSGNSSLTLSNTSGTQGVNLAAAGNFDVTTGSTLLIGATGTSAGPTVAMGTKTLTVTGGGNTTITGNITGTGGLVLNGGTLTLSGANSSYTGGTTVLAGTLNANLTDVTAVGSSQLGYPGTIVGGVTALPGNPIYLGASSGSAAATVTFTHSFNTAGSPSINNPITAEAGSSGTLTLKYVNTLDSAHGFTTFGNITLNNNLTISAPLFTFSEHITFQNITSAGSSGNYTLTFDSGTTNANTIFLVATTANAIQDGTGTVAVDVKGNGKLQYATTTTYSGGTTIENSASLQLEVNNAVLSTGSVTLNNSGILNFAGSTTVTSQQIGALSSASTTTTVENGSKTGTVALTINNGGSYAGKIINGSGTLVTALNLAGGTLTLSGILNTYSGGTTVTGGVLSLTNASASATGTAAVAVNGGALAGTGFIAGASALVTVNSGGAIAPGVNTSGNAGVAGTIHLNGGLTLTGGSQLDLDVSTTAASGNDLILVSNLTLPSTGQTTVNFNLLGGTVQTDTIYKLIGYTGTLTGSAANLVASTLPNSYIATFSTTGSSNGELDVVFTPEPASLGLVTIGGLALLGRRRRQKLV